MSKFYVVLEKTLDELIVVIMVVLGSMSVSIIII